MVGIDVIKSKARSFGRGWMRPVFALGLLVSLCGPVSAATRIIPARTIMSSFVLAKVWLSPRGLYLRTRTEILIRPPGEALVAVVPEGSAAMAAWLVVML